MKSLRDRYIEAFEDPLYMCMEGAMATKIQLSEEQAFQAYRDLSAFVAKYNAEHEDTEASIRPLPGGNVQLTISKITPVEVQAEVVE